MDAYNETIVSPGLEWGAAGIQDGLCTSFICLK